MVERGQEDELALRHYLSVLWRQKFLVAAVVVAAVVAGVAMGTRQPEVYRSDVQVLLQPPTSELLFPATGGGSGAQGGRDSGLSTEIAVMTSRSVREAVSAQVGGAFNVNVAPQEGTRVVAVVARDRIPGRAEQVAQIYAETYISTRREQIVNDLLKAIETVQAQISTLDSELAAFDEPLAALDAQLATSLTEPARRSLDAQRSELLAERQPLLDRRSAFQEEVDRLRLASNLTTTGGAQIVGSATDARLVARTGTTRAVAAGLLAGLTLGVLAAFAVEHFGSRITGRRDVIRLTAPAPILAMVPRLGRREQAGGAPLVIRSHPHSPVTEAFRRLRSTAALGATGPGHSVLVTSPSPGDGKTFTAANLALVLARAGQRTILVDADLHRPRVHEYFRLANQVGVTSVLEGTAELGGALQAVPGERRLRVLTSGPPVEAPSELLASHDLGEWVLARLASVADVVVVDSPPLLAVADTADIVAAVRAVAMVVREGQTRRDDLTRAVELLDQMGVPLVGTVLNAVASGGSRSYYKYYRSETHVPAPAPGAPSGSAGGRPPGASGNGADSARSEHRQQAGVEPVLRPGR